MKRPSIWLDGATGTLGRALVEFLTERHYSLVLLSRNASFTHPNHPVLTLPDLGSDSESKFRNAINEYGAPTGFISASGISLNRLACQTTDADWNSVFAANLFHPTRILRWMVPSMFAERRGSIILISSLAATNPRIGQAAYAASKAALEAYVRATALEFAKKNVRINAVAPGFIDSKMLHSLPDKEKIQIRSKIPLDRWGTASEVATTSEFLLSDRSSYITGQTISMNGGYGM
ncbi:MAG: SDR family oxidoreductase [Verrucomicrobiota bacterium]